jgi:hypothetical protein
MFFLMTTILRSMNRQRASACSDKEEKGAVVSLLDTINH